MTVLLQLLAAPTRPSENDITATEIIRHVTHNDFISDKRLTGSCELRMHSLRFHDYTIIHLSQSNESIEDMIHTFYYQMILRGSKQ